MAHDIRYAGLDTRFYRQLIQAVNLVYSSYNKVTAAAWDGSSSDLLVVDPSQADAEAALREADALGVPAIVIAREAATPRHTSVPSRVTTAYLTEVLRSSLTGAPSEGTERGSALVRVATEPGLAGRDADASLRGRAIALRPSAGQVFAYSRSELLGLAEHFGEKNWTFESAGTLDFSEVGSLASVRLEAFYLLAADAHQAALPSLPNDDFRLQRSPNLDQAVELEYPLKVAGALRQGDRTAGAIAVETGLSPSQVTACLWAFQAADVGKPAKLAVENTEGGGLFSQLLGHFRGERRGQAAAS